MRTLDVYRAPGERPADVEDAARPERPSAGATVVDDDDNIEAGPMVYALGYFDRDMPTIDVDVDEQPIPTMSDAHVRVLRAALYAFIIIGMIVVFVVGFDPGSHH